MELIAIAQSDRRRLAALNQAIEIVGVDQRSLADLHDVELAGLDQPVHAGASDPELSRCVVQRDERRTRWGRSVHDRTVADTIAYALNIVIDPKARDQARVEGAKFLQMIDGRRSKIRAAMPPSAIPFPQPTRRAIQLSCALAVEALPTLNADIRRWGGSTRYARADGDVVDVPYETSEFIAERYYNFGLPLSGACVSGELDAMSFPYLAARTTSHPLFRAAPTSSTSS